MKDKVSELMDGELNHQDAKKVFAELEKDESLYRDWDVYHLIGDSLRKSPELTTNVAKQVSERISSEPIVLAPVFTNKSNHPPSSLSPSSPANKSGSSRIKVFAFATAASLLAMVSTWLVMHNVYQQSQPVMVAEAEKAPVPVRVLHTPVGHQYFYGMSGDMTNYLYFHDFHKELSPNPVINRQPAYIYPVTDFHDNHGR